MWIYILLIVLAIMLLLNYNKTEHFNEETGRFCSSCKGKTFNQCTNCFNCGFCVKNGTAQCLASDIANGPYNNEKCDQLYLGDPWLRMQQNNNNYELSYGPKQGNRIVGEKPCGMQSWY
ncbi:hypothetical protein Klosneuvirus_5_2 [Klosneuvirus KNV1]|uniref:Uncharacterized protein n=1 Tax=Klosneuvirus KNV1 TaxID=1977640 RepID=A0A1V0SKT5_9VIRU|nr:hypothetical protein Klosneuvirus_1_416 [Klosneuvirus KNV1]ARF12332.1 hypothetical protein Klosneuvirus_5_2 [Klosneuvirus KNV1]